MLLGQGLRALQNATAPQEGPDQRVAPGAFGRAETDANGRTLDDALKQQMEQWRQQRGAVKPPIQK
jgi:hypothetical protein